MVILRSDSAHAWDRKALACSSSFCGLIGGGASTPSTRYSTSTSQLGPYRPDRRTSLDMRTAMSSTTDAAVKSNRVTCLPLPLEEPLAWALTTTLELDLSMGMDIMTARLETMVVTEVLLALPIHYVSMIGEARHLQKDGDLASGRTETGHAKCEDRRLSMAIFLPVQRQTYRPGPVQHSTAGLHQPVGALPTTPTHTFRTTTAGRHAMRTTVGGEKTLETLTPDPYTVILTDLLRTTVNATETAVAIATENGTVTKDGHVVAALIGEEGTAKTLRGERDYKIASVSFIGDEANTSIVAVPRICDATGFTIVKSVNSTGGSEPRRAVAMIELSHLRQRPLFQTSAFLPACQT